MMSNPWRRGKRQKQTKPTAIINPPQAGQFQVITQTHYSGPVVHPDIAEQWEAVLPGSADRIMAQFEKQSAHRQTIELKQLGWNNGKEVLGMVLGFLIFLTGVIGGVYLISIGKGTEGLIAVIVALITPLALFLAGRKGAMAELMKKRKAVTEQPPQAQ